MKFSELKCKEVINCKDGVRLGYVTDLEIDVVTGKICNLIVPEQWKWYSCFCSVKVHTIPYCNIVKIGPDVIVVSYDIKGKEEKRRK